MRRKAKVWIGVTGAGVILAAGAALRLPRLLRPARTGQPAASDPAPAEEPRHEREAEDEHGDLVHLTREAIEEIGIQIAEAGPVTIRKTLDLPGEARVNEDREAHIVARVPGIVREVRKGLGDPVREGERLAVIESRELADAKSAYLAARQRWKLAESNHAREERLWKEEVSAEKDYLAARQALAGAQIELRAAEQKLHALGLSEDEVEALPRQEDTLLTRYEIAAPFAGTVIEKHITVGEYLKGDHDAFTIADLSTVWVDVAVYPRDIPHVRAGQDVRIRAEGVPDEAEAKITYMGPLVGDRTRTALARIVLPNPDGVWMPGMFVTASITTSRIDVPLAVRRTALIELEGETVVFVEQRQGVFEPRPVKVGRRDAEWAEILDGLRPGDRYAADNAFTLKAEIIKRTLSGAHAH